MNRDFKQAAIGGFILSVLAIFTLSRLEVVVDISQFMLGVDPTPEVLVSQAMANGPMSRTLVLVVEGTGSKDISSSKLSRILEDQLAKNSVLSSSLESISASRPKGVEETLWQLYQSRTLYFFSDSAHAAEKLITPYGVQQALSHLLDRLNRPHSSLVARIAPEDPWLVLLERFESFSKSTGSFHLQNGRFVTSDEKAAILFLQTKESAFDGSASQLVLKSIKDVLLQVEKEHGLLSWKLAGLHRFSAEIERSIKRDIRRVSVLSTITLLCFFLALFRSLRIIGVAFIVVSSGFIVGLTIVIITFGKIHGLTLAFGSSLIGVSIDYVIHYYTHFVLGDGEESPRQLLNRLWAGLQLGAGTTVLGFVALAASGLPGLLEVSIFSATGIAAALGATWLFLPGLVSREPPSVNAYRAAQFIEHAVQLGVTGWGRISLWARAFVIVMAVTFLGVGLWQVRWDDNVVSLARLNPELVTEEEAVRGILGHYEQRRWVVVVGDSLEEALQINDKVNRVLKLATEQGELDGYRSLASFLPSAKTQESIALRLRGDNELPARIRRTAAKLGFTEDGFKPFIDTLSKPMPQPLTMSVLSQSSLGKLVESFVIEFVEGPNSKTGVITFLSGVVDAEALHRRVAILPDVMFVDQGQLYVDANVKYRRNTMFGLLLGFGGVIALAWARYRRATQVLMAIGPALAAVIITISSLGWIGVELNIVALTALLMVFSMGVDYGVFISEPEGDRLSTQLAIVVAWASTVAGFGLLALSAHPAMRSIGLVAGMGVTACLLLLPGVQAVLRAYESRSLYAKS